MKIASTIKYAQPRKRKRFPSAAAKYHHQPRKPHRERERLQKKNLLEQKLQRRDRLVLELLRIAHHFDLRPAVPRFPNQIGQKNRQRERCADPNPFRTKQRA